MSALRRWLRDWRITLWHQRHREIRRALRSPFNPADFIEVERSRAAGGEPENPT